MIQLGESQSFLAEALASGFVSKGIGRQDLHGHVAVQPLVVGAIHLAHAAATQLCLNTEMTKRFADHGTQFTWKPLGMSVKRILGCIEPYCK